MSKQFLPDNFLLLYESGENDRYLFFGLWDDAFRVAQMADCIFVGNQLSEPPGFDLLVCCRDRDFAAHGKPIQIEGFTGRIAIFDSATPGNRITLDSTGTQYSREKNRQLGIAPDIAVIEVPWDRWAVSQVRRDLGSDKSALHGVFIEPA
jgi:hypothetical protein